MEREIASPAVLPRRRGTGLNLSLFLGQYEFDGHLRSAPFAQHRARENIGRMDELKARVAELLARVRDVQVRL